MASLIWLYPDGAAVGSRYEVRPDQVIGRGDDCQIRIDGRGLSRRHARLRFGAGGWTVEDLGSTNGTRVNHVPILAATPLRHADMVGVGDIVMRFDDEPAAVPASGNRGGPGPRSAVAFVIEDEDN